MSLTREHRQEALSFAYISAVAAKTGYNCGRFPGYDYGIDIQINSLKQIGRKKVSWGPILWIQAKASHNFTISIDGNHIIYDLKVDTYNMLIREDQDTPTILVLYCMPRDEDKWLSIYENCTALRHCGYWMSLRGMDSSTKKEHQRIKIPKEQRFTDSSLKSIMARIEGGGYP